MDFQNKTYHQILTIHLEYAFYTIILLDFNEIRSYITKKKKNLEMFKLNYFKIMPKKMLRLEFAPLRIENLIKLVKILNIFKSGI